MPVIGVPILPTYGHFDLTVRKIAPTTIFGEEVLERRPGVRYQAGVSSDLKVALISEDGEHIVGGSNFTYKCRFTEGVEHNRVLDEKVGSIVDVDYSIIQFPVPEIVSSYPGVYIAGVGIFVDDVLRYVYNIWIYNEPSPWAANFSQLPHIDEIRLLLRDSSPVENELLNTRQFGIEEYAQAAVETVRYWNDTPPYIIDFNTINFPFRKIYLDGMFHFLFEMLVEWYRKNRFPYNAGGVSIDDMGKMQEYMVASQKREQDLRMMVQRSKSVINLPGGFGKLA